MSDYTPSRPQPWMADSACLTTDPDAFFPDKGAANKAALMVCADCPVRDACLNYAIQEHITIGIYGGTTAKQRKETRAAA